MPYLRVTFSSMPAEMTLERLSAAIVQSVEGAQQTSNDWYAKRRQLGEEIVAKLKASGNQNPYLDAPLLSIDRARQEKGPAVEISVPMGQDQSLVGRLSKSLMFLHSDAPVDRRVADQLIALIRSMGIELDFEVSDVVAPSKRMQR